MALNQDLEILQGKTFTAEVRGELEEVIYKPVAAVVSRAPLTLTVTAHGAPDGWRAALTNFKGIKAVNAANDPPRGKDFHIVGAPDANTLTFNDINATDYGTYTAGTGVVQYKTPFNMANKKARMTIKDRKGGTVLVSLTTENGELVIDAAKQMVSILLSATATALYTWAKGVYDLEIEDLTTGTVTLLAYGNVALSTEVTT